MQSPPTAAEPPPGEHRLTWKLLIAAIVALVALALFALGAFLLTRFGSEEPRPRPVFAERLDIQGADGNFAAVTTNLGQVRRRATCTVNAYDIHGTTIGSRVFELEPIAPGAETPWEGRVRVDGVVERMDIDCR
jgi:hypothetical protein